MEKIQPIIFQDVENKEYYRTLGYGLINEGKEIVIVELDNDGNKKVARPVVWLNKENVNRLIKALKEIQNL